MEAYCGCLTILGKNLVENRLNWVLSFLKCIVNSDGNAWIYSVEP